MTLNLAELLRGNAAALAAPPPPESSGDFMAGTIGVVVLITMLAAQEAEQGVAVRVRENAVIRDLFRAAIDSGEAGDLAADLTAAAAQDTDLAASALEAENSKLKTALIALHVQAEAKGQAKLEKAILHLLHATAQARTLKIPNAEQPN